MSRTQLAENLGWNAYTIGRLISENPYPAERLEHHCWNVGWKLARKKFIGE